MPDENPQQEVPTLPVPLTGRRRHGDRPVSDRALLEHMCDLLQVLYKAETQKSFKYYSSCVHHAIMWRKHEGKILCKEAIAKLASEHAPSIKAKDVKKKLNVILKEKCLQEGIVSIEDTIKEMITFLKYTINNCIAVW
ncbi:hypothetical protein ADUPG1_000686 [Aduncisulcus paluster]|uniref:Uncharacterized protein n=1 Tax=Aduncisulcus paluster TaxID=2918883 RepID=A0ABQ5K7H6_9EUKA|nr:hypothetical protein ADUPG1_000686 [Aduncisulcus paluster]